MATRTLSYKARTDYTITDASKTTYSFPFVYLKKKFIKVYITDAEGTLHTLSYGADYTVDNQEVTILTTSLLVLNNTLSIRRVTATDVIVTWNDGSVLLAADMTLEQVQLLHLQEEQQDYLESNTIATVETEEGEFFDANGLNISNVADPKEAQDVVTKSYMESVQDGFVQRNKQIETNVKSMQTDVSSKQQQALSSQTAAAASASTSKGWAVSTGTPDGATDADSTTGKTQSSRTWALFSKEKSQEANTSATNAKAAETNAKASETNASTSEQAAATSATNAKASETSARSSAQAASTSATNAESSAQASSTSATKAKTSETNAANSAKQAAESAGVFQDFTGATAYTDGTGGKVPKPLAGQQDKVLKADGTWGDNVTPHTLWEGMHSYPIDYVPSDVSNKGWNSLGVCSIYYNSAVLNNQPTPHGQLINIPNDYNNESAQLWVQQPEGNLFSRAGNAGINVNDTPFKQYATTADVANDEKIVGLGSNWIRYKSGLQLCWVDYVREKTTWTFPIAFSSIPTVVTTALGGDWAWVNGITTTGCIYHSDSAGNCLAVGRWL